jgi:hypothetical protein
MENYARITITTWRAKMKKLSVLLACGLISACMTTGDVQVTGPNSYVTTSVACPACGGVDKSIALALEKASSYCSEHGKHLETTHMDNKRFGPGAGQTVLEVRCIE